MSKHSCTATQTDICHRCGCKLGLASIYVNSLPFCSCCLHLQSIYFSENEFQTWNSAEAEGRKC